MAERIPPYFGGQCPPPPPPPPPPPAAGYGNATAPSSSGTYQYATAGQHSYALGYNYAVGVQKQETQSALEQSASNENPQKIPGTTCKVIDTTTESTTTKANPTWTCDACDITLDSEKAFKGHRKSHVKCSDCSFEASPKVVKAHYQALHGKFSGSGFKTVTVAVPGCKVQKFKICVGNRPEDIQKWIEERKKRFPRTAKSAVETTPTTSGLSSLLAGYGSSDDSDNDEGDNTANSNAQIFVKDSNETKEPMTINSTTAESTTEPKCLPETRRPKSSRLCRFFSRNGVCRNGDNCQFRHEASSKKTVNNTARKRKRGGHTSSDTLLRKLLRNDMERESTLSLQILKYIVHNNFFLDTKPREARTNGA